MKRIKYIFLSSEVNYGTEKMPNIKQEFIHKDFLYSDETLEAASREAYNGEYEIYDDGVEEVIEPTQLDRIEAQVFYTAMQTDTLIMNE